MRAERGDDVFACTAGCGRQWVGAPSEAPDQCLCGAPLRREYRVWEDGALVAAQCVGRPSPCNRRGCPSWATCPSTGRK
jgi:hypothetical protein